MKKSKSAKDAPEEGVAQEGAYNSWANHSNYCATDTLLRSHGFSIYSRPKVGEPTWERKGNHHPQSAALRLIALENGTV